ncbi:hypothetical protein DFQ29_006008 [Apophysomyces sp. BC1021]|nr:hypothetical protein DFQ29_006008 [Apophysomyces sp. BC1021]
MNATYDQFIDSSISTLHQPAVHPTSVSLVVSAAIYRFSAGHSLCRTSPQTPTKPPANYAEYSPMQRQVPAWEICRRSDRRVCRYAEDSGSCSSSSGGTFDSNSTSHSDTPLRKNKKISNQLLLRQIRRLRSENAALRNSVDILKNDLRVERESRKISEECHQRFYDDAKDKITKLDIDLLDRQDVIEDLRNQLSTERQKSSSLLSCRVSLFSAQDSNDEDEFLTPTDLDMLQGDHSERFSMLEDREKDEEDEEEEEDRDEVLFETLANSYLRQALVAHLTSARANLELDDLMLKYDPSSDVLLRTLSTAFISWIGDTVYHANADAAETAQLMKTGVQEKFLTFWKPILERYVYGDDDQLTFLNAVEIVLSSEDMKASENVAKNFHRLLFMLYQHDIVEGDAVMSWWKTVQKVESVAGALRTVTRKLVEWIESEDEEDDEEDDDDEDDDDTSDIASTSDCNTITSYHTDIDEDDDYVDSEEANRQLEELLKTNEESCLCQFEKVIAPLSDTTSSTSCACHTTCTIEEKKKKSVTIQL